MDTLKFIADRWKLDLAKPSPILIRISRFKSFIVLLKDLGFKEGAEIGVCTGRYSLYLVNNIPGLRLHCVDPWEPYSDYVEQHSESDRVNMQNGFELTKSRLKGFDCNFIRKYSMDAVKNIPDGSLDFVFIDGNHSFRYVIDDIDEWTKKVRSGGLIAGHDYFNSIDLPEGSQWKKEMSKNERIKICQVRDAVDAWTKANHIKPWFCIDGDKCPSFFWVRQ